MNENINEMEFQSASETETQTTPPTDEQTPPTAEPQKVNPLFNEAPVNKTVYKSPMYVPSLVLGILSMVFALLIALVGDILGIIGISLAVSRRYEYNVTAGLICSIVGLVIAIVNHILAFIILMSA